MQDTTVYNAALEKLGSVQDVMIDKSTGRIAYAILSFDGFLGVGDRYYPLPWEKLRYNTEISGYVVDIDRDVLEGAPSYTDEGNRGMERRVVGPGRVRVLWCISVLGPGALSLPR